MMLRICHLYPDVLNLYGDGGNVTCLRQRMLWRGLEAVVDGCGVGDELHASDYDLLFIGGGQGFDQPQVLQELAGRKGAELRAAVEDGLTVLAIDGGYQLLGRTYRTADGTTRELVGALDLETICSDKRMIGDYLFTCDELGDLPVVGFENHAGKTWLGSGVRPLGRVTVGAGNNGEDGTAGARYRNVFGSYAHGCLLPKNPELADYILKTTLERKYGSCALQPLDDALELRARAFMLRRLTSK